MTDKIDMVEDVESNNKLLAVYETPWRDYLADKNYSRDISTMCEECVQGQIKEHGHRVIECKGLLTAREQLGDDIYESLVKDYTEDQVELLEATYSPYSYMEAYIDAGKKGQEGRRFAYRWYQERILSCLPGYTSITMSDGLVKSLIDVKVGEYVKCYDPLSNSFKSSKVVNFFDQGIKKVYRVYLSTGTYIDCTDNHLLLRDDGFYVSIETGGIKEGVYLKTDKYRQAQVSKIELLHYDRVYDIEVEIYHNFIANNIVVHNCSAKSKVVRMGRRTGKTFAIAALILHKVITNSNYRILLVSPFAVQTEEIVENLKNLCLLLPENPLLESKASPNHVLKFASGSIVKGFTAGTDGNSIRGQPGHLLILDECLVADTMIETPVGKIEIKYIEKGDTVISYVDGTFKECKVTNKQSTGFKETFKYILLNKKEIEGTSNHPVMTSEGWKEIGKAKDVQFVDYLGRIDFSPIVSVIPTGVKEVFNLTVDDSHTYIANDMIVHNCDDIPVKAIISIMGIKLDNPNVEIWRSGTPKGEFNLAQAEKDPATKAFHYPSFVIPHYDDALDKSLREDLGEIGFIQEAVGEFGTLSNGVFQNMFISRAQKRSKFIGIEDVLKDRERFIINIGVDWNHDQVGTRIVVVAYDKINPLFSIVEKACVAVIGHTQEAAINLIVQLNRKYNADHIFCDEGFGAAQVGILKSFGERAVGIVPKGHPDLKLLDVRSVNFSSNTEFKDHISGEVRKTPTKQFAVHNTTVILERDLLALNPEEDKDIIAQMKNYIEKSRNKGKIVYSYVSKKVGDHDLDALMFALYGFRVLYSTMFDGPVMQTMLKFSTPIGEGEEHLNQSMIPEGVSDHIQLAFSRSVKNRPSRLGAISTGGLNKNRRSIR